VETNPAAMLRSLSDPREMQKHVVRALSSQCGLSSLFRSSDFHLGVHTSSVLLLLGEQVTENGGSPEFCVILNKRSKQVKQPGDICCPGGGIELKSDTLLSKLLALPGLPLWKWPCWKHIRKVRPDEARVLSILLATGIRESWEEMHLNPLGLTFLGPLTSQCLILYRRVIHPMVVWVSGQQKYTLSWEVDRVVTIPLRELLNPYRYAVYRVYVPPGMEWRFRGKTVDFPCYIHTRDGRADLLWGATFRIVTLFLELAFGFVLPDPKKLPLAPASLSEDYINGRNSAEHGGIIKSAHQGH